MDEIGPTAGELPGAELVDDGLADLAAGRESANSEAVAMAAVRLRAAGIEVPVRDQARPAAHRLYDRLARQDPRNAHSSYNAIVRRMVSYARAAERAQALEHARNG